MNIDNVESPILKYKTDVKRSVTKLISSEYTGDNEITVKFRVVAKNVAGDVVEDKIFAAVVGFDIGEIDIDAPSGTKFDFTITNYKLNALK